MTGLKHSPLGAFITSGLPVLVTPSAFYAQESSATTSQTVTPAAGRASGDLLVALITSATGGNPDDPDYTRIGFSTAMAFGSFSQVGHLYTRRATANTSDQYTASWTATNANDSIYVACLQGASIPGSTVTGPATDFSSGLSGAGDLTVSAATVTAPATGIEVLVATIISGDPGGAGGIDTPAGFTKLEELEIACSGTSGEVNRVALFARRVSAGATGATSVTGHESSTGHAMSAAKFVVSA